MWSLVLVLLKGAPGHSRECQVLAPPADALEWELAVSAGLDIHLEQTAPTNSC